MHYRIVIDFDADRLLTEDEINGLIMDLSPQIEEPRVYDPEEGSVDAEWKSDNIAISLETSRTRA